LHTPWTGFNATTPERQDPNTLHAAPVHRDRLARASDLIRRTSTRGNLLLLVDRVGPGVRKIGLPAWRRIGDGGEQGGIALGRIEWSGR